VAGFLAPQISDIGAARGGASAPADTSVGNLLGSVAKIFDAAVSPGPAGPQPTQKDRDSDLLRPYMQDVANLEAQREKLGPAQFNARLNTLFSGFVVANPQLVTEAREGVLGLTGLELGTEDIDLFGEAQKGAAAYLQTSEGLARLPGLIADSMVNGEVSNDLLVLAAIDAQAQDAVDEAELVRLNTQLGIEQATSGINEVRLKGVVDDQLFKMGNVAQKDFQGIVQSALITNTTFKDGSFVLGELRNQRATLLSQFENTARKGGFANHPIGMQVSLCARTTMQLRLLWRGKRIFLVSLMHCDRQMLLKLAI